MKIISKFKDYYDYVQYIYGGGDEKIIYDRKRIGRWNEQEHFSLPLVVEINEVPWLIPSVDPLNDYTRIVWLIVCGKPYPLINVSKEYLAKWEILDPKKHKGLYKAKRDSWLVKSRGGFTVVGKEDERLLPLIRKVDHPIFIINDISYGDKKIVRIDGDCPILSDLGLASIYPAEQLYQDISYFISNTMKPSPDMSPSPRMTDKEKIQQHGFDLKGSFRHRK